MSEKYLGRRATDKITGFTGVITAYVAYLTGCNQCQVTPRVTGEGSARDAAWFDVQRLELNKEAEAIVLDDGPTPGFGQAPVRSTPPAR